MVRVRACTKWMEPIYKYYLMDTLILYNVYQIYNHMDCVYIVNKMCVQNKIYLIEYIMSSMYFGSLDGLSLDITANTKRSRIPQKVL